MKEIQPGIFERGEKIFTKAVSEEPVYSEKFVTESDEQFREWNPNRSKVGAAVKK